MRKRIIVQITFLLCVLHVAHAQDAMPASGGVVINGVIWAAFNVDAPGTFAKTPESAGKFYQWNCKTVSGSKAVISTASKWERANDPSPKGWRVPTSEELNTLFDTTKVTHERVALNGVVGCKFTDKESGYSLFFPAAGYSNYSTGEFYNAGVDGYYWSATPLEKSEAEAYYLDLGESGTQVSYYYRSSGFSVRPVRAE
ncbi:MAG: fibrobacter succinogenes major paralogous domain-containing protein [Bacteroidetes bacterium]|nr:fibrobacter succinogenes major paralogous domain-containing protein [Bacteroidota bacterium]